MTERQRLLILIGSPRKNGNSAALAGEAARAAQAKGAEVETLFLHDLRIGPCAGCGDCRMSVEAECILEDEMRNVYPKLRAANGILIATPIYSYNLSAQTKLLIDRLYALGSRSGNALMGKRFGFIIVYGGGDEVSSGATTAMRCFHDTFDRKASWMKIVHGSAGPAGAAAQNKDLMREAAALGDGLASPA
jgi:multimeric flavodoxin WrbA